VLAFRRGRRRRGQGVVVGGDAMSPGAGEIVDDDQHVMAESIVWSSSSLASQSDEEAWPETWAHRVLTGVDGLLVPTDARAHDDV
jgi:hypothetical protein